MIHRAITNIRILLSIPLVGLGSACIALGLWVGGPRARRCVREGLDEELRSVTEAREERVEAVVVAHEVQPPFVMEE